MNSQILVWHPFVYFKLKEKMGNIANEALMFFPHFLKRHSKNNAPIFSPWEKERYMESLGGTSWNLELIREFKKALITPEQFNKLVHSDSYRSFLQLWMKYEKKKWKDEEDLLACHPEQSPQKLLLLNLHLSELEKIYFRGLTKSGFQVQYLSPLLEDSTTRVAHKWGNLGDRTGGDGSIKVLESKNEEDEIRLIAEKIKELKKHGVPSSEIYLYSFQIEKYKQEFRRLIPEVTLLPFRADTLVFGKMKYVFVCGLSYETNSFPFIPEEDKQMFNKAFQKTVFKTYADEKEEIKLYLQHCISESENIYLTYSRTLAAPLQEFFKESINTTFSLQTVKKHPSRARSLRSDVFEREIFCLSQYDKKNKNLLPQTYSAHSLEQYQKCPYGFWMKECLGIKTTKTKTLELTALEEGELLHFTLKIYFLRKSNIDHALQESFQVFSKKFEKEILDIDRIRVEKILKSFLSEEETWQSQSRFNPKFFELSFGLSPHEKPLILKWNDQELILKGKIDRVDIDQQNKEFKIIDYKSGSTVPSTKEILLGKQFQLIIYAMAVEEHFLTGYWPSQSFFYLIKDCERKKGFEFTLKTEWEALKERTLKEIFLLKEKIEQYQFPSTPKECYMMCDFKSLCEIYE